MFSVKDTACTSANISSFSFIDISDVFCEDMEAPRSQIVVPSTITIWKGSVSVRLVSASEAILVESFMISMLHHPKLFRCLDDIFGSTPHR